MNDLKRNSTTDARTIENQIADLQRMLLPHEFPPFPGYSFAVHYQPCDAAGGDFYGWQIWQDGTLGIGVADVSGHGLRAAVVMSMLRTWLAAYKYFDRPPELVLEDLNGFFAEVGDLNCFVTVIFTRIQPGTGKFSFRNCGHPSPRVRRRDGAVESFEGGRSLPLGIMIEETKPEPAEGLLQPGDALVLYTDGITESAGADGSFFDCDRLDRAIAEASTSPQSIIDSISKAILQHRGTHRRRDDECILVLMRD